MNIALITVGKIKEKYLRDAVDEYAKRLPRYCKLEIVEVADEKTPDNASEKEEQLIKEKEENQILKNIKDNMYVITLEITGAQVTSDYKLSFSKMTFPHQLFRVMLLEQVYRAFRIINGEPYHK